MPDAPRTVQPTATASTSQAPAKQQEPTWKPGQYYIAGQPVPEGAIVVPHEGGLLTLERRAKEGFDKDLNEKLFKAIDKAFSVCFKEPDEANPAGVRPFEMKVNRYFRQRHRGVLTWGELEPACDVVVVADNDPAFSRPGAIVLGPYRVAFDTTPPNAADDEIA